MYWENPGPENTDAVLQSATKVAEERGISTIVVASNSGATALRLAKQSGSCRVVCVSHVYGFAKPGECEMPEDNRRQLKDRNIDVCFASHALSGAERGISRRFSGVYPVEIAAQSLRMLGQGVKVCVEISIMALDAGLIPFGEDVIAIAGTGRGADTAVILRPAHTNALFDTYIREIICKPLRA